MHLTALWDNREIIELLLETGAQVTLADIRSYSSVRPLFVKAYLKQNAKMLKALDITALSNFL